MKYAIVPYPIPELLLKSGLIAQSQESARKNNGSSKCIVSYKPSFNKIFNQYPNFDTVDGLNLFLSKNPQDWDASYIDVSEVKLSGISEVVNKEASGTSHSLPTHDFSDRTTWYCMSVRVEGEALSLPVGSVYQLQNTNIIDLSHGKITREDSIYSTYGIKVYKDGVILKEDVNYTVDYALGKIDMSMSDTGLTVDYSYENGSSFIVEPPTGKVFKVKDAEIQFTQDLIMKPTEFELWVYNPQFDSSQPESNINLLRVKLSYASDIYKSYKDIINIAKRGTGKISSIPGFANDIMVFPFHYERVIELKSSIGMQIRVRLVDEEPMIGEWGTMTFYVIEEDDE